MPERPSRPPHAAQPFLAQAVDGPAVGRICKYGASGDKNASPRFGRAACRAGSDPSVDLQVDRATRAIDHGPYRANLRKHFGKECLTPKARIDAHDEHKVARLDHVADRLFAGRRIEHDAGALAEMVHVLDGTIQMG